MEDNLLEVDAATVRERVSAAYGKRVSAPGSCCGAKPPCGKDTAIPKLVGYTEQDLERVPEGSDVPSFGCGNPLAFGEVQEGQTVVDLGSGAGLDLLIAVEKVGRSGRVIGVDMTDEMIGKARANVAAAGHGNVEIRKGLIEDLPVESGTVDWVISNCVINLSPEKGRVFAEIARVLKPGGRMLVSDIVAEDLPSSVRGSLAAVSACVGGAISEAKYVAGLREAGLTDVEVRQRHAYTCGELKTLAESTDLLDGAGLGETCAGGGQEDVFGKLIEELGGNVASVLVSARKPSTDAQA